MQQVRARPRDYRPEEFERMLEQPFPITCAVNNLKRCMVQPELHPLVLSPPATGRLGFVHGIIGAAAQRPARGTRGDQSLR